MSDDQRASSILHSHTNLLLNWGFGDATLPPIPSCPDRERERLLKAALRTHRRHVVLLGIGNGQSARFLAANLPSEYTLTVCELQSQRVRESDFLEAWKNPGQHELILDPSIRAQLLLLHASGRIPQECTQLINPGLPDSERESMRTLQRLFVSTEQLSPGPDNATGLTDLSLATILHPAEPALPEFFAQFPKEARELIVFWDAPEVPRNPPAASCPTRHFARTISNNFAAQRNAALHEATGKWVFFLDGDERLESESWKNFGAIVQAAQRAQAGAIAWPRLTFWPDSSHVLAGFGLWPDLQVRLIRKGPTVHFERPVHEVVTGYDGPVCIAPGTSILHHSRLLKNEHMLAAKLKVFDAAAGRTIHRLNTDYPSAPLEHFRAISASFPPATLLRLKQT